MALLTRAILACALMIGALIMVPDTCAQEALAQPAVKSQCVRCHTRVKGLIRLSWAVEK